MEPVYLTVSALTKYIKVKLEQDKHLVRILIKGEISNFKRHSRGHFYFTLKDEAASISCIMFSRDAGAVSFDPKEGDHVLIEGKINIYEPSGTYSIQVRELKLDGIGELYLQYEKLKKELSEKGYFADARKKAIPKFPKKIGVITSPTGAVIEDIKNTVQRRYLLTEVHLYPALVQGPGASQSLREQIELANRLNEVDVLIVGRGGGSIEDLWGFNELETIEAIYRSQIPIITAIGHETDFTLSDFVSDLRAPTPTAAAELATPNSQDLLTKIAELTYQNQRLMLGYLEFYQTKLLHFDESLERLSPKQKLERHQNEINRLLEALNYRYLNYLKLQAYQVERFEEKMKHPLEQIKLYQEKQQRLQDRLAEQVQTLFERKRWQFNHLKDTLKALSPLALMDKGYALVKKGTDVLTSIQTVKLDDNIEIELKDGYVYTKVSGKKEK
ncbi:MAG: exodeoxyribonuclease VII large subunit [Acholeplasmataceae bacterium]|nr:exodeoxyribonuclease VII large subunit [Acholeplasmataceae bacterium]